MKVLVGCEYSGIVAKAFRDKGHDAISCDILPGDISEYHIQGDIFEVVKFLSARFINCPPPLHLSM